MLVTLLKSKLHRIKITDSQLNYEGSITLNSKLMQKANILPNERVEIYNINNGERFATYALESEEQDVVCINGAAARLVQKGDLVIVCTYAIFTPEEAKLHKPTVILF